MSIALNVFSSNCVGSCESSVICVVVSVAHGVKLRVDEWVGAKCGDLVS